MPKPPVEHLKGKEVIVMAGGVEYRGILVEVGIDNITISTPTRWISIPFSRVSSVKDANKEIKVNRKNSSFAEIWNEKYDPPSKK